MDPEKMPPYVISPPAYGAGMDNGQVEKGACRQVAHGGRAGRPCCRIMVAVLVFLAVFVLGLFAGVMVNRSNNIEISLLLTGGATDSSSTAAATTDVSPTNSTTSTADSADAETQVRNITADPISMMQTASFPSSIVKVEGYSASGITVFTAYATDSLGCYAKCQSTSGCLLAAFGGSDGYCYGLSGTDEITLNADSNYQILAPSRPGRSLMVEADTDYPGNDILGQHYNNFSGERFASGHGEVPNAETCGQLCSVYPGCNAATWMSNMKWCFLKTKADSAAAKVNTVTVSYRYADGYSTGGVGSADRDTQTLVVEESTTADVLDTQTEGDAVTEPTLELPSTPDNVEDVDDVTATTADVEDSTEAPTRAVKVAGYRLSGKAYFETNPAPGATSQNCLDKCQSIPGCAVASYQVTDTGPTCTGFTGQTDLSFRRDASASVLTVTKRDTLTVEPNTNYPGNDIAGEFRGEDGTYASGQGDVPDGETCMKLCVLHPRCTAATYSAGLRWCFLKRIRDFGLVNADRANNDTVSYHQPFTY